MKKNNEDRNYKNWLQGTVFEDEGDYEAAASFYYIAAKGGGAGAQLNYGNVIENKLMPPQPKVAVYWYKKALKSGMSEGAWNLAMHYKDSGVKRWYNYWLKIAARMGDEDAIELLSE